MLEMIRSSKHGPLMTAALESGDGSLPPDTKFKRPFAGAALRSLPRLGSFSGTLPGAADWPVPTNCGIEP